MKEVFGDLWTYPAHYRVITTNGAVKRNGALVMGRGCAREALDRFPGIDKDIGELVSAYGNRVFALSGRLVGEVAEQLITFPVKHHWSDSADLDLIRRSALALEEIARGTEAVIVMPRPGCGNGRLRWEDVKPLLLDLPDNVHVITWEKGAGDDSQGQDA